MLNYREQFASFEPTVYLNCAYHGPFPRVTAARIQQAIELKCYPYRLETPDFFDPARRVREQLARLVGADPAEIALTNSATQGIGIVATGLGFRAGDEVVVAASNFPSNLFTWLHLRRLGVRVHVLKPDSGYVRPEDVAAVVGPRTRVVALDWVSYNSGVRIDLAAIGEIAHRYGALFLVDGTQGVGALEIDVRALPMDVLVVAAYKWLLGPYGTGFAYFSNQAQARLELQVVNWFSVEDSENFDALPAEEFTLVKAARIFDVPETASFLNLHGLEASLEFVEVAGVRTVTEHCKHLLGALREGLLECGYGAALVSRPELASTILTFSATAPVATRELYSKLKANHIEVSMRQGLIRVSPYLYNNEDDIRQLLLVARGG